MVDCESTYKSKENQLKWCSVPLSEIFLHGRRLEAGAYDIESKRAISVIESCKFGSRDLLSLDGPVKAAYHAPRFKRKYVPETAPGAVGFLGSAEMLQVKPKAEKFITGESAEKLNLFAEKETVLMSCSGTIGRVSYASESIRPFALSQHIIRIVCKEYSGYIYACLSNQFMQQQIRALTYGAVIQEIEPEHLARVIIPEAPREVKEKIHHLIVDSYKLRDSSNFFIDEATQLLAEELSLPPVLNFQGSNVSQTVNAFCVKLSELRGRVDASYHIPVADDIINHLKAHASELTVIGDQRISEDIILAGVFKRTYVEEEYGYPFLGGREITQLNPKTEKYLSRVIHKKRYEKELKVTENMILVTDRGTIGITALVPKHWNGYAVSQNVLKLIPADDDIAGYLFIFLNSEWGMELVRRHTYGSVIDMIDSKSLASVEIPLLKNKEIQMRINSLALSANRKRYEAYQMEKEALRILDEDVIHAK